MANVAAEKSEIRVNAANTGATTGFVTSWSYWTAWIGQRRYRGGLHAVLRLHFAQEDESYLSLADDEPPPQAAARDLQTVADR